MLRAPTPFAIAGFGAVLVVLAVHFLQFPGSVPDFTRASGGGKLLDVSPAFTTDAIYRRLSAYGEAGRQNYSFRNVTADVFLPLSVFPFLWLLMRRAIAIFSFGTFLRRLLLSLPVTYVAFDLIENACVYALIANYPERISVLATSLPYMTVVKRVASLLALGIPLTILGYRFVRRHRHGARTPAPSDTGTR